MNNIAKISAAGSGKTWDICYNALQKVHKDKCRVLITTYTNRGIENIRNEIKKQNLGVLHPLITIKSWYSFLLSDMIKPYQNLLTHKLNYLKSFDYSQPYKNINFFKTGTDKRYTNNQYVRANESSSLVIHLNNISNGKVIFRLEEIYDTIFFDEIQDLAGYDIDIIELLLKSKIDIVCCGDNKQATFSTHNTRKNKNKSGKNIWQFLKECNKKNLITIHYNLASRRFNNQICTMANKIFPAEEPITTVMNDITEHDGIFLIDARDISMYYELFKPQVLRYDSKTETYPYNSINFGACKGETFDRVIIFPNKPLEDFLIKQKTLSSPEKYYVAVTRARYSVAFVLKSLPESLDEYTEEFIKFQDKQLRILRFVKN